MGKKKHSKFDGLTRDQVAEIARDIAWNLIVDVHQAQVADLARQAAAAEARAADLHEKYREKAEFTEIYNTILYPKAKTPVEERDIYNKVLNRPQ